MCNSLHPYQPQTASPSFSHTPSLSDSTKLLAVMILAAWKYPNKGSCLVNSLERTLIQVLWEVRGHVLEIGIMLHLENRSVNPGDSDGKELACNAGDPGSIPGLGRSPREENGNPLLYSCLENSMDRGAWWVRLRAEHFPFL